MEADQLGFRANQVVQEYLFDEDVETSFRDQIQSVTGTDLVDEDYADLCDGAIIWWRSDDAEAEDLEDVLVDAIRNLDEGGYVWVVSPKSGLPGYVSPVDIEDAAKTVGLNPTTSQVIGAHWVGVRMDARIRP